jgi:hypothetical protein
MFRTKTNQTLPTDIDKYIFQFFSVKYLKKNTNISHAWQKLTSEVISESKLTGYEELASSRFDYYLINSVKDAQNVILEAKKRVEKEEKNISISTIRSLVSCLKNKDCLIGKDRVFHFKMDHPKVKIKFIEELTSRILPWTTNVRFSGHFLDLITLLRKIDPNKIEYTPEWDSTIIKKFILAHLTHTGFLKDTVDALMECYFTMPYTIDSREFSYYQEHPYYDSTYRNYHDSYYSFLNCSVINSCSELIAMDKAIKTIKENNILTKVPEIKTIESFRILVKNLVHRFTQKAVFPPDNLTLAGKERKIYNSIKTILSQHGFLLDKTTDSNDTQYKQSTLVPDDRLLFFTKPQYKKQESNSVTLHYSVAPKIK